MSDFDAMMPWYALHIRSRYTEAAKVSLESKGYTILHATWRAERRWRDRVRTVDEPLFPGYLFCRLDVNQRLPVLQTPGVIGIVGFGNGPVAVPELEVDAVRSIVRSGLSTQPHPYLRIGEPVHVAYGPLAGIDGLLVENKGASRVVVSVHLLQRSVAVEIDRAWLHIPPRRAVPDSRRMYASA